MSKNIILTHINGKPVRVKVDSIVKFRPDPKKHKDQTILIFKSGETLTVKGNKSEISKMVLSVLKDNIQKKRAAIQRRFVSIHKHTDEIKEELSKRISDD